MMAIPFDEARRRQEAIMRNIEVLIAEYDRIEELIKLGIIR